MMQELCEDNFKLTNPGYTVTLYIATKYLDFIIK